MLTFDALTARRATIDESPQLGALRDQQVARAAPLLARMPPVPQVKALLSRDGGICPDDGAQLEFDPWSPEAHRCPRCGRSLTGERHHAHWARAQHLWLAERAAHLAAVHALTDDPATGQRARDLLAAYYDLYFALPNRDNVLGPSHLFFSTYLESIWILDYLSAAFLLREVNALDEHDIERIDAIANEAATIIAEFNEGMSNRQTWNSAALAAVATWFGDEDLAISAIEGRTGLLGHLADGFGTDGMWFEGENYHLFAMRGLMVGLHWAATAGAALLDDDAIAAHLGDALMAPTTTALPDLTFPARKDARFGVSLAHPAYIECWEAGLALLGDRAPAGLPGWIDALYRVPPRHEQVYDSYLHEAGLPLPAARTRADLSWWALLTMAPSVPPATVDWVGSSRLMEQQGLAIIRHGNRYLSLECSSSARGHGHPDRLHVTLFADGVHWLPDPGTGSYTSRDLFWYRSTLAHNAPRLDEEDQSASDSGRCEAFEVEGEWAWCSATWNNVRRTLVSGPRFTIDVTRLDTTRPTRIDLPWHLAGVASVQSGGTWQPGELVNEFVDHVERFVPGVAGSVLVEARAGDASLHLWLMGDGDLLRATGPGLPGSTERHQFLVRSATRNSSTFVTVIDHAGGVTAASFDGSTVTIREGDVATTLRFASDAAIVTSGASQVTLAGALPQPLPPVSFVRDQPMVTRGEAIWVEAAPALDGTLRGFVRTAPLRMDEEHHYFRSESPYEGPEVLAATAWVNWSDDALFVAVDVVKDRLVMRPPDAAPLNLDNEPDDINADGIQVYWRGHDLNTHGWLVTLTPGGALRSRPIGRIDEELGAIRGAWQQTPAGYLLTIAVPCPHVAALRRTERLGFDLIVNEMREGRIRRAGQLVWSGGPGWVYLRGDRHDPSQFGELELAG